MPGETTGKSEKKGDGPPQPAVIKPYCPVTVEPIIFLVTVAYVMSHTLRQQYIYYRVGNGTVNQQGSSCHGNISNSTDHKADQAVAIQWATALEFANGIPSLIVSIMIGSVSDKLGRKLNLIIPVIGCLVNFSVAALVVQFKLPLAVLLPGTFAVGLMGNMATLHGGSLAYIADFTTEPTSRYFRHAILLAMIGAGSMAGGLVGSIWFKHLGLPLGISQPFWFSVGVTAFCLVYTICALKETYPRKPGSRLIALSNITGIVRLFKGKRKTPTWPVAVLTLADFLLFGIYASLPAIVITYLVGPPFCWAPDFVGFFQVAIGAGFLVSMGVIKLFSKYPYALMAVGYISGIACFTLVGLGYYAPNQEVALFMGAAVGCVQSSCSALLRTTMSRMVGPDEQGSLFGLMSFSTNLGGVTLVPLWNLVFSSTIPVMSGLVFLVFAGVVLISALLTGFVKFKTQGMAYEPLVNEEVEKDN